MSDLTYTATGSIDETNQKLILDIFLPQENEENRYVFDSFFDLSKISIFNNQVNVIFCKMKLKDDGEDRLYEQTHKHRLEINLKELNLYRSEFDMKLTDTLFLLFHDKGKLAINDLELFYQNIESIYKRVRTSGNFNHPINIKAKPRVLGMSIIIK